MLKNLSSATFSAVRGVAVRSLTSKAVAEPSKKDVDDLFNEDKAPVRRSTAFK